MEEREQDDRLSEAFWRADEGSVETPRQQVRRLSGIQAERRTLRAKMRDSEKEGIGRRARRWRRDSIGEDVASENGGNRHGNGSRSPSGVTYVQPLEAARQEDERPSGRLNQL
ncbi:uncharacterized protein PITG_19848 [Phytophthora infestans T30-4]|uniref:Uncharacterized protein n=1 Tax=Phytophthora infestans (strain T30-4) TaxID=403677 RepID=D0P0W6_PHYIT|nr:uncharacterized protein PITG_19848 [Phytophthora infestans T30-4]EEY53673.1 hypothetical protein PITG_19848 [Phytophthora infestans T30-4]|eukprot:XP_002896059.1 hypothetical protein PITG_19848 [Phytophthora infestans T30-4]